MLSTALGLLILSSAATAHGQTPGQTGVLLLAHGGAAQWNERVNSSVITSTEYLLGLRAEAPADLKIFAKMLAEQVQSAAPFASVDYMTVRDDAALL